MANARAPQVSMIKLTQSIWTEVKEGSFITTLPRKTMKRATTLTASWNLNTLSRDTPLVRHALSVNLSPLKFSKMGLNILVPNNLSKRY